MKRLIQPSIFRKWNTQTETPPVGWSRDISGRQGSRTVSTDQGHGTFTVDGVIHEQNLPENSARTHPNYQPR